MGRLTTSQLNHPVLPRWALRMVKQTCGEEGYPPVALVKHALLADTHPDVEQDDDDCERTADCGPHQQIIDLIHGHLAL